MRKSDEGARILIIAAFNWAATARLAISLVQRGLEVGVLAPADHLLHKLDHIAAHFDYSRTLTGAASCLLAIRAFKPTLLVPCDDSAVRWLHELHDRSARHGFTPRALASLIERSLGDPSGYSRTRSKSCMLRLARELGIAAPRTEFAESSSELREGLEKVGFPAVLKADVSWSGIGVKIVPTIDAAIEAYGRLTARSPWPERLRNFFTGRGTASYQRRILTVQQYVVGRPANRAVFCHEGRVLAGLSVEVLQSEFETWPATVVRIIDHPAMAKAAESMVAAMRMSGFVGFDFQLENESGEAKFLEMNPRATQICHLCRDPDSDQISALAQSLGLEATPPRVLPKDCQDIALFPQELWRDPNSAFLRTAYHDVPWEELDLVTLSLQKPVPNWRNRLQDFALGKMRAKAGPAGPIPKFQPVIADQEPV